MSIRLRRRAFIAALGSAAAWPLAARAQQGDRVRRIGVLVPIDESDPEGKPRLSAFTQALAGFGWTDGHNVRIDLRWGSSDINRIRALAQELVGLQPDVIVTNGSPATAAVARETRAIPIVFANLGDPVASSIVARLDRPSVRPSSNKIKRCGRRSSPTVPAPEGMPRQRSEIAYRLRLRAGARRFAVPDWAAAPAPQAATPPRRRAV